MIKPIRVPIVGVDRTKAAFGSAMKKMDAFKAHARQIGTAMTIGVTLPILAAGTASVVASNTMNSGMANVATLIPNSSARIFDLKKNVQDLAIDTGIATGDITGGLYQVVSAFGDASDTAEKLRINTKAAVAGVATTTDAINLTSAVTKAYGDTSAAAIQKVADLGFHTVKLGQTTFPELAASIGSVAPLAKVMNVSLEEMFGVLATTTGVVGNTSEASTQLASILTAMIKPTDTMSSLFAHLGYASGQAMVADLGFAKTLQVITGKAKQANVPLGNLMGRIEALITTFSLTGAQAGDFAKKLDLVKNSSGKMDEAFNEQVNGIGKAGYQFRVAKQQLTVLAQSFGDIIVPGIGKAVKFISPFLDGLRNMSPLGKKIILVFAGIAAMIGPIAGIAAVAAVLIPALLSPISAVVVGIAVGAMLIGAAAALIIRYWSNIKTFFIGVWGFVTKLFHSRIGQILLHINPLTLLPTLIINNWSKIAGFFKKLFGGVSELFKKMVDGISKFELPAWVSKLIDNPISKWMFGSSKGNSFFGPEAAFAATGNSAGAQDLARMAAEIHQSKTTKSESTVKVEFANAPAGTRIRQDNGPSMDLNNGFAMAGN